MDKKNEIILQALIKNSRIPLRHISAELKITETAVRKRIKNLERKGILRAYTVIVDPFYLGYEGVALVGVDATPETVVSVFEKVKELPNIRYSALTSGDHMMMFEVWCRDSKGLNAFLKKLERTDGVTRVCPAIMLRRVE
ncbi:MAG: Lrp/AsnC family transcriptional regulator [Candidatus Micrarchaeota archaeon]